MHATAVRRIGTGCQSVTAAAAAAVAPGISELVADLPIKECIHGILTAADNSNCLVLQVDVLTHSKTAWLSIGCSHKMAACCIDA